MNLRGIFIFMATPRELDVLAAFARLEAARGRQVTLGAVAGELGISRPSVHGHAQGLLRAGLLVKHEDGHYGVQARCPACGRAVDLTAAEEAVR